MIQSKAAKLSNPPCKKMAMNLQPSKVAVDRVSPAPVREENKYIHQLCLVGARIWVFRLMVTNAFRPTTPGNSPGAGHSFGEYDEETEQKPAGRVGSNNGDKEGFRGHSPGGGHAFVSKKWKPNA
ncbi:Detected protein of unknown function [Hibiscus syriacus]|uniref:Uncharacterized protein n=1 Tax=Hibiscus syriacus TaxID=106335 RepID=A0A6A3AJJ1_HIBSY|nr:Detected protein of unknown function [Hibiscus syriacus]